MHPSKVLQSVNPATAETLGQTPITSPEEIVEAAKVARSTFKFWSQVPLENRLKLIGSFRSLLCNKQLAIAELISKESGQPISESLAEVFSVLESCAWLQKNCKKLLQPESVRLNRLFFRGKKASTVYEPLGVIAVISPWNFPLSIPASSTLMALATGNTVLLKPSPRTPLIAKALADLLLESGFPAGSIQLIQGDRDEVKLLLQQQLERVVFTGSVGGGKAIMKMAADNLQAVTLELGGKHPAIVLEDADLPACADSIVWGAFTNAGQACASIERLYVADNCHDELLRLLKARCAKLRLGDPLNPRTDIGPLIDSAQVQRVRGMISRAKEQGASVVHGGRTLSEIDPARAKALPGNFLEPCIISGANQSMEIMQNEIFGPVLPVVRVSSGAEAIALANDSRYGLGASIWSRNLERAKTLAGQLNCGMVWINDGLFSHVCPEAPWGGIKDSGFGRTHGKHSLLDFVNVKFISEEKAKRRDWHFPYSKSKRQLLTAANETLHRSTFLSRFSARIKLLLFWMKSRIC